MYVYKRILFASPTNFVYPYDARKASNNAFVTMHIGIHMYLRIIKKVKKCPFNKNVFKFCYTYYIFHLHIFSSLTYFI